MIRGDTGLHSINIELTPGDSELTRVYLADDVDEVLATLYAGQSILKRDKVTKMTAEERIAWLNSLNSEKSD